MTTEVLEVLLDRQCVDDAAVLVLRGDVADADADSLRSAVDSALASCSRGVVLDLSATGAVATSAADAVAELVASPRARLAVCGAPSGVRDRLVGCVPLHEHRQEALDDLAGTPSAGARREVQVDHGPQGPRQARQAVQAWADDIGLGPVVDDLLLIVSELVTNAVRHGTPPVRVTVGADDRTVSIGVVDGTAERPAPRQASDDAESGRGLLLISLLSTEHGVRPEPPGKVVWARLLR